MARTIATGQVDIQLIGLPDVKRQLENVPRLMDGVARATINFNSRLRQAVVSAGASVRQAAMQANAIQKEILENQSSYQGLVDQKYLFKDVASQKARAIAQALREIDQQINARLQEQDYSKAASLYSKRESLEKQMYQLQVQTNAELAKFDQKAESSIAKIAALRSQLKSLGRIGSMDPRSMMQAEREGQFNLSAVGGLKQFREATLGTQTIKTLNEEEAALGRLEQQIDMTDKANIAFIQHERERIRLSRESIDLERMRVLDPKGFQSYERRQQARLGVSEDFSRFEEGKTHQNAIRLLDERAEAVNLLGSSTKYTSNIQKAFIDQTIEEISKQKELLQKHAETGREQIRLRSNRESLVRTQKKLIATGQQETKLYRDTVAAISKLDRSISQIDRSHAHAGRRLHAFNRQLRESADGSRTANYRMQQLSFAGQDAVQVYGQTGLAGALHASANNLSMFVMTLENVDPKMLAFGGFALTAGMMALSSWLQATKDDAKETVMALAGISSELDTLTAKLSVVANTGGITDALRSFRDEQSKLELESRYNRIKMDKMARDVPGLGAFSSLGMSEGRRAEAENARMSYMSGQSSAEEFLRTWSKLGLLSENIKEEFSKAAEESVKIADRMQLAKEAIRETALATIRQGVVPASESAAESTMRQLQQIGTAAPRIPGNGRDELVDTAREIERKQRVEDLIKNFSPSGPAPGESLDSYSRSLTSFQDDFTRQLEAAGATADSIRQLGAIFDEHRVDIDRNLFDLRRSASDSADALEFWNMPLRQQANAVQNQWISVVDQLDEAFQQGAIGPEQYDQSRARALRGRDQKMSMLESQHERDKLSSRFMGRDGTGDSKTDQLIKATEQTSDTLDKIAFDPHLNPAEKTARGEIAMEAHRQRISDIQEQFNRVGMSDPRSLHKQIQMSLSKPKSEKLQEDQNKELAEQTKLLEKIADKVGVTIGP